jgi:hypothetical protein
MPKSLEVFLGTVLSNVPILNEQKYVDFQCC